MDLLGMHFEHPTPKQTLSDSMEGACAQDPLIQNIGGGAERSQGIGLFGVEEEILFDAAHRIPQAQEKWHLHTAEPRDSACNHVHRSYSIYSHLLP